MSTSQRSITLKLAASPGALSPLLANLLALQRAEEPETQVLLEEAPPEDLLHGLGSGRYDFGITWTTSAEPSLRSQPLWNEELGIAVPSRSPLLVHAAIPSEALQLYPLIQACIALSDDLLRQLDCPLQDASSFELMAALVAAGYGIGVAPRSRISQAHGWGIVCRPLAGGPHSVRVQLLRAGSKQEPAADRFAERAAKITAADH
ncbi:MULTISPECIES: substrate-binding domain-containing protein [Gammaproteobacteria]|uniref:substrate-binding domain-containing protein n=1 Tax=Gammaproteobacteria TaxID=1236 RepID=UPI0015B02620|nr:substrate-binding domain-containing protein [Pseudomonas sp. Hp2]